VNRPGGTGGPEYPWTEAFERAIGHDPARFLDRPLGNVGIGDQTGLWYIKKRIQGIRRLEVLHLYRQAEKNLAEYHDREPRDRVLDELETQEELIEQYGELEEALQEQREIGPTESNVVWPDREGGTRSGTYMRASLSPDQNQEAATDGGRDPV
jgi:hypothetical protein